MIDGGISSLTAATETSSSSGDFSSSFREIGAALIDPNLASALFQRTIDGSHPATEPPPMALTEETAQTTRSYFDNAGQTLAQADAPSFAEGAALAVTDAMLPKLVPSDFKVELTGWDCSGTETFTMDTSSETFKGCMDKFASQFSMETCTDAAYEVGGNAPDAPVRLDQRDDGAPALPTPP